MRLGLFWALVIAAMMSPFQVVYAYKIPTHAYLTQAAVDFYNQNFSDHQISDEAKAIIIGGAQDEDETPRYLNHFYDPLARRGLSFDKQPSIVIPGVWNSAKDWAEDESAQREALYHATHAVFSLAEVTKPDATDFTWQAGIRAYSEGDYRHAALVLGHILHLIEDMGVPEHVRNDPHAWGCPYEDWTSIYTRDHSDPELSRRLEGKSPILFGALGDYFDDLASYTNTHFYSFHTIGIQSGYQLPVPAAIQPDAEGSYGLSEEGYRLFFNRGKAESILVQGNATLDNDSVMRDYWDRLSVAVVQHGAGIVRLFVQEGERAKTRPASRSAADASFMASMLTTAQDILKLKPASSAESMPFFAPLAAPSKTAQRKYETEQDDRQIVLVQPMLFEDPVLPVLTAQPPPTQAASEMDEPITVPIPFASGGGTIAISPPSDRANSTVTTTSSTEQSFSDHATATVASPVPLQAGVSHLSWTTDPVTHGVVFSGIVTGPSLVQNVRLNLVLVPLVEQFSGNGGASSELVPAGDTATISFPVFQSGDYHWRARAIDEDTNASDWGSESTGTITIAVSPPFVTGAFTSSDFPNGLCGFGKSTIRPDHDTEISSIEFYAACANGSCQAPNNFQIFDASGTLVAESNGQTSGFGYPGATWNWQLFTGANKVTLFKDMPYLVAPASSHGQCMVNPSEEPFNTFYLR